MEKQKLLVEIFKKTKYFENFLYGKFLDSSLDKSFENLLYDNNKARIILFGLIGLIYQIIMILTLLFFTVHSTIYSILLIPIVIFNSIFFVTSILISTESKWKHKFNMFKYIFQLFSFFYINIAMSLVDMKFHNYIFTCSLFFGFIITWINFSQLNIIHISFV